MAGITGLEKRLQIAGVLLMLGLMIEAVCLLWARPVAFIVMVCVGGLFWGVVSLYTFIPLCQRAKNEEPARDEPVCDRSTVAVD
jgi:hypothetical protein